jgi:O-antigen/teichoic acid export membrane protein
MMDYSKRFLQGTLKVLVFSGVSVLIGFFIKFFMARTISVNDIGLFFSVLGCATFFIFFRDLGLADSLVYFIPKFLVEKSKKKVKSAILFTFYVEMAIGVLFFIVFFFISNYLAKNYFKDERAVLLILFLAFYFVLDGIHEVLMKTFQGYQRVDLLQGIDLCFQGFSGALMVLALIFKKDVVYFGLAYIFGEMLCLLIFYLIFIKKIFPDFFKIKEKIDPKFRRKLLDNSLPTMTATIADVGYAQQTTILLTLFSGLESVGYYVMVNAIAKLPNFLYKASSRVFAPMISELERRKRYDKLNYLFKEQAVFISFVALPIIFGLFFFSDVVLRILYGETFVIASTALKFASLCMIFYMFNNLFNHVSLSLGFPKLFRNNVYVKFTVNLLFNLLLIPMFGFVGAVVADLISIIAASVHILYFNIKHIKIKIPIKELLVLIGASLVYVLSLVIMKTLIKHITTNIYVMLFSTLFVSGGIYCLVVFYFKVVDITKLNEIVKKITDDRVDLVVILNRLF